MVTRASAVPIPIQIYHPPLKDLAESDNKSVKMPTNSTDKPNMKAPMLMPMAEEQTAKKSGSWGVKDLPSSSIPNHQDDNDPKPSFRGFTEGLKTPASKDLASDDNGHFLWSHEPAKREHDPSSDHAKITSNPTKWKWLSLTLIKFDEDDEQDLNEDDPNDSSYHAKDGDLKYLGMEPGTQTRQNQVTPLSSTSGTWIWPRAKMLTKNSTRHSR